MVTKISRCGLAATFTITMPLIVSLFPLHRWDRAVRLPPKPPCLSVRPPAQRRRSSQPLLPLIPTRTSAMIPMMPPTSAGPSIPSCRARATISTSCDMTVMAMMKRYFAFSRQLPPPSTETPAPGEDPLESLWGLKPAWQMRRSKAGPSCYSGILDGCANSRCDFLHCQAAPRQN